MTCVYLIRHGRAASLWGQDGADPDPGLAPEGRLQAQAVAERLMALPQARRPVRVIASPLRRARETAQPFAERLGVAVEIDPRFGEIPTPGDLAPEDRPDWLRGAMAGDWSEIAGDIDYDAWRRGIGAALAGRGGCAVFSHFVALNAALSCATGAVRAVSFRPDHTSISIFETDSARLALVEQGAEASTSVL